MIRWLLLFSVLAALLAGTIHNFALGFPSTNTSKVMFEDKTEASGIAMLTRNSASSDRHLIETMGGGVAVFDYNNDGLPDIYIVNGAEQPSLSKSGPEYLNRLYRNEGNWKFTDVTKEAGIQGFGFDIGGAAADFDNDGYTDLLVTSVNKTTLYRNTGNGRFEDVTASLGPAVQGWTVGAAWLDIDNDGYLDLFVVRYVDWDSKREPYCGEASPKVRTYCHPRFYPAVSNLLFRNNGNGTFTDISVSSGIAKHKGKGMSAAVGDYDDDGRLDIFVANDAVPNFLFHNEGGGRFTETAFQTGVALNDDGVAVSSMGAEFRDLDNDGREDIAITALMNEAFPLFRNLALGRFVDHSYVSGLARATNGLSGWGIGAFDFDNDGLKDLFIANGDVQDNTELFSSRRSKQKNLCLRNNQAGAFEPDLVGVPAQHRGAAFADFDRDGRVDVVVAGLNARPELLRNISPGTHHWLDLELVGTRSNRSAIGTKIIITTAETAQTNRRTTAVGYASSSDSSVHFGLGTALIAKRVEVFWSSGAHQVLQDQAADKILHLEEPR